MKNHLLTIILISILSISTNVNAQALIGVNGNSLKTEGVTNYLLVDSAYLDIRPNNGTQNWELVAKLGGGSSNVQPLDFWSFEKYTGWTNVKWYARHWATQIFWTRSSSAGEKKIARLHGRDATHQFDIYDKDDGATTNISLRSNGNSFFKNGNFGIGTTNPQNKLDVCGAIRGKEVLVEGTWCDFVFDECYDRPTLEEEKEHIESAGYLLGFESEEEMAGEINLGDVTKRQQQKIEEQMLHIIDLNELIQGLVKDMEVLKTQIQK